VTQSGQCHLITLFAHASTLSGFADASGRLRGAYFYRRNGPGGSFKALRLSHSGTGVQFLGQKLNCPFCLVAEADKFLRSELCYVRWEKYPATEGHQGKSCLILTRCRNPALLIVPNRHFSDYFSATPDERTALWAMLDEAKKLPARRDFLTAPALQNGQM
jgi:hypothetical protein